MNPYIAPTAAELEQFPFLSKLNLTKLVMCQTFLTHRRFGTSQNPLPGGDEMSMVNADSVQLFAMLKKNAGFHFLHRNYQKSVKMKYEQLGCWMAR